ncbi:MAG: hypothetical protein SCALA702_33330 [Melioribacteraceae bacterium]|nr:MAG: hypothetical protein SCALA702_33330 [Melioribacteraceae bacterium]
MNFPFQNLAATRKLENSIFLGILLFIFKVVYPEPDTVLLMFVNELLILASGYMMVLYIISFLEKKVASPIAVILNAGIFNAILFFIITVYSSAYDDPYDVALSSNFIVTIIFIFTSLLLLFIIGYIFVVFRELFFLRQKKSLRSYMNTMVFFLLFTALGAAIKSLNGSLEFIFFAFLVVSMLLIFINSLRVAWIAFLTKKQKLQLLGISIVLSVLFGLNFAYTLFDTEFNQLMNIFSPGFGAYLNLIMLYGTVYFGVIFFTTLFHLPTAEAFDRKSEEISTLIDLSKLITQVFDFKELAETVTTITMKVCYSDAAWLVIEHEGKYELSAVSNIGYKEAETIFNGIGIENYADLQEVLIISEEDATIRSNFLNGFKSLAISPLLIKKDITGYLFAVRKVEQEFDDDDKKNIGAFADYAALALENAKHLEASIENERMEKELDLAREVQYKILPSKTPEYDFLEISSLFIPAFEVGGDYYDFFKISESKLGFVIADVSGKGISASFVMAEVKGIFESISGVISEPAKLLTKANEVLSQSLDKKTFVTAVYGIIDVEHGKITFARAGHTPVLLIRDNKAESLTPTGLGLGIDHGNNFLNTIKELEFDLKNNDIIVLYTDGIPESQNAELEEYGYKRFEEVLIKNSDKQLDYISNEIIQGVTTFSQNSHQHDDITLVLFKWNFNNNKFGVS